MYRVRRALAAAVSVGLAVSLAACADSERGEGGDGDSNATLTIAGTGKPKNFDPIFNDDGESYRPARQMYDTLIQNKAGTAELEPALATKWDVSPDGKQITFTLREGVKFHDGSDFNAEAVCFNLDRWFNMKGAAAQSQMIYYGDVFGGWAKNETDAGGDPYYKGCEATNPTTAVLQLNKFRGALPAAFTLTAFSISSPTALKKYDADKVTQSGDSFTYASYATEHPTGTGPFKFQSYDASSGTTTLVRNDDYWGEKAKVAKLVIRTIESEPARKQELESGAVDIIDYPAAQDWKALESKGMKVEVRPAFNILYMGMNEKNPKLKDLRVRQAIAYAINREQLVKTKLPEGAEVAKQFMPKTLTGYASDATEYAYDPAKAKQLLAAAGATNLTLKFYYPSEVTRPYMPDPKSIYTSIAADLTAVGIKIEPVVRPWNGGYKDDVQQAGKHDLHLLGWTGDFNDAYNFVGTFFGREKPEFGFTDKAAFAQIAAADAEPDAAKRKALYEQVNRDLVGKYLPAVPISHSPPAIATAGNIDGLVASPLTDERFASVSKS
ncbi:peptide/nickel transport system substrate-binding protein [Cryptosporangium aurantiacum]|uniref:Peptide/nickel transport system substrate-binding protein n=1 Tax=Cryptosporangium aurantiacum TaxID=134849 RepID=A0A1M7NLC2_9ACTN|nr:peptide/nickel transport system substrate-binding protein [Cryptosporangium aurantiacum]